MTIARRFALLALNAALVGCDSSAPLSKDVEASIVGTWSPVDLPAANPACEANSVTFTADGKVATQSGAQILRGTYASTRSPEGLLHMTAAYSEHNGQLNCQGLTAEFVISHTRPEFTAERKGEQLRLCYPTAPVACFQLRKVPAK